jgi:hypothetical protein
VICNLANRALDFIVLVVALFLLPYDSSLCAPVTTPQSKPLVQNELRSL